MAKKTASKRTSKDHKDNQRLPVLEETLRQLKGEIQEKSEYGNTATK